MALGKGIASLYLDKLIRLLSIVDREQIDHGVQVVADAWLAGKQIITLGNGGSSMTALHFINDWNKTIPMHTQRSFRGRSLVDNIGLMMSYANDISFEDIFVGQLKNILEV